jgi:hypothetical protein
MVRSSFGRVVSVTSCDSRTAAYKIHPENSSFVLAVRPIRILHEKDLITCIPELFVQNNTLNMRQEIKNHRTPFILADNWNLRRESVFPRSTICKKYAFFNDGQGSTTTNCKRSPNKNTVSFADICLVRSVLPGTDYTAEEISACWYSKNEYFEIRQKVIRMISTKEKGHICCVRGLERFTPEAVLAREDSRMEAYTTVLVEQERQFVMQTSHPEAIARKYRAATAKRHQQKAHAVGRNDELIAMKNFSKNTTKR